MAGTRLDIVLVKLGAIAILVNSLQTMSNYSTYVYGWEGGLLLALTAFIPSVAIPIAIAAVLWFFPATILGHPLSEAREEPDSSSYSILFAGIALLGLYALVFGIIDLAYFETQRQIEIQAYKSADFGPYRMSPQLIAGRIATVIQILFGAILLIGRKPIANALRTVRRAGTGAS
jgi:hypothetical protein